MDRWEGQITEVAGRMFTALLNRPGAPELCADFDLALLPDAQPGDVIVVTPDSVSRVDFGRWTQEEIDEIGRRARECSAALGLLAS